MVQYGTRRQYEGGHWKLDRSEAGPGRPRRGDRGYPGPRGNGEGASGVPDHSPPPRSPPGGKGDEVTFGYRAGAGAAFTYGLSTRCLICSLAALTACST